jgi:hypothetical protein
VKVGILLYNVSFTANTASQTGSDVYENVTSSQSFYTASTLQLCCSSSTGVSIALSDGTDKSSLLPECVPLSGERYLSSSNSYDTMNQCLDQSNPCETLAHAISNGQAAMENTISVTVLGQYEDINSSIPGGEFVHIHSPENARSVPMCICLYFVLKRKCVYMYNMFVLYVL